MALLTTEKRKLYFEKLKLGEYNESNIKKLQKKYLRQKDVDGIYGPDTDNLLRHIYNVKTYTTNFEPEEFKCECGGRHCTGYPSYMKKVELQNLQKIRTHYGKPLTVTCGMRCRGYNAECRGSISNSLHLSGYACDFYISGVTDTLANRKKSIKWMKKLDNTNYIYGNGINSNGYAVSAPYMGNALHYDTSQPKKVVKETPVAAKAPAAPAKLTKRAKLAKCANDFAYSTNTKKAAYPDGSPKEEYSKAIDKAYGTNRKWSTQAKKGASCDVFVGTCVRAAGIDKNFPRGLSPSYLAKSNKFKRVSKKDVKSGDIIVTSKHICIVYDGKIKEASNGKDGFYPKTTNTLKKRLNASGAKVYRALEKASKTTVAKPKAETWVDKANAWAKKIAADNSWHYVVWNGGDKKTQECPICHDHEKGKHHGWNCIGFSFAYLHHGGGLPCKCSCGVIDNGFMTKLLTMDSDEALKQLQKKTGLKDLKLIRNNKKTIPQSKMKPGDLCLIYDSHGKCLHIYPYIGNGYMIDCGHWADTAKQIAKRKASPCKVVIRYTGK